ncbi:helix-turn-helix domain-containing protein [Streptomyces sp. NPDC059928]|uniref:helix-turn-helix domain-containing protein n=1 Tax=unclassified Streptomyces TaxID=2593676 RepID=UPI0036678B21
MGTDYQQARSALGTRLRELRLEARLTGAQLAAALDWPPSKVSKLEHGRQTATTNDLERWTAATGTPHALNELTSRLQGFESHIRSWRRQLANGHGPVQETWNAEIRSTATIRVWEEAVIVGMLQTADYARHMFLRYTQLHGSTRDIDEAVRARMRRQEWLYEPGRRLHAIMWEPALHALICPPSVLAAQLDRLAGLIGMDTVELGIVPLSSSLKIPTANGFWILDDRLTITEDWHAELWLDDEETVGLYTTVWNTLRESAVYGADAHRVIARARSALNRS